MSKRQADLTKKATKSAAKANKATKPNKVNRPKSGAQQAQKPSAVKSYFDNHLKVSKLSFKEQIDRPIATLLTCSVIGIALVLPTLLLVVLSNVSSADLDWEGSAQITLFLTQEQSQLEAGTLANKLTSDTDVASTRLIDKDQALQDFSSRFELDNVIEFLDDNPLPHAIVVTPAEHLSTIDAIERLQQKLLKLSAVESAQLDALWIQRLQSITSFLEKAVLLIALMLAVAVLLILGNTIRLAIENRKEEIAVLKLVGGTRAFVCRPFLYMGLLYGLGGSIIAAIFTQISLSVLYAPIQELAQSYQSDFNLSGLGFESTLALLFSGTALGWLGAWIAVHRHLDEIEPS